jgi:AcrR family transcriptional regulator
MISTTREKIIQGAIQVVSANGYSGATSRAIAAEAGVNQALVYYHFDGVDDLLVTALDEFGSRRLERYTAIVDAAVTLDELVGAAEAIYRLDRRSGHVTFVSQLVAGSATNPELASAVLERLEPWIALSERALTKALAQTPFADLPIRELAYAVVTYYLGLNMLTHLDPRRARADALLSSLRELLVAFEH